MTQKIPAPPPAPQNGDSTAFSTVAWQSWFARLPGQIPKAARPQPMTTAAKNALALQASDAGFLVFDTTLGKLCVWVGTAWQTVTST